MIPGGSRFKAVGKDRTKTTEERRKSDEVQIKVRSEVAEKDSE
jgi:hypothetical protein